jgi:hypothetical protein
MIARDLARLTSLNLGCGSDIRHDCVNLDRSPLPGIDVIHDISMLPFPFPIGRFDRVICQDVLEHVDIVSTMRELHRVISPGGTLEIRVPHFTSANTYGDPTHIRGFSVETFDFFCSKAGRDYYFDFHFAERVQRRISFSKGPSYALNYVIEPLVNASPRMQVYYERSLIRIFPAVNVYIRLRK